MADETKRKRGRPTGPGTNNLNLRVEPDLPLGTYWFRYFGVSMLASEQRLSPFGLERLNLARRATVMECDRFRDWAQEAYHFSADAIGDLAQWPLRWECIEVLSKIADIRRDIREELSDDTLPNRSA